MGIDEEAGRRNGQEFSKDELRIIIRGLEHERDAIYEALRDRNLTSQARVVFAQDHVRARLLVRRFQDKLQVWEERAMASGQWTRLQGK